MDTKKVIRGAVTNMAAYVPGARVETIAKKYAVDVSEIVKLASNENPFGMSPLAIEAIQSDITKAAIYPDSTMEQLRKKLGQKKNVGWDQIMVGAGGSGCLQVFAETFISEDDEIIIGDLAFYGHKLNGDLMGAKTVVAAMNEDYSYNFDAILDAVTSKTKVIYVTNPNNPSGIVTPKTELEPFLEKVPKDIFVVLDEAYYEFSSDKPDYPDSISYLDKYENIAILRTFSKVSGMAGLRVGYMISSKEVIFEMLKVLPTFAVNSLALTGALAALDDSKFLEKTVKGNQDSLKMLMEYFDANQYRYLKSGANFIFVNLQTDSRILHDKFCAQGLILRPGYLWGKQNWMRISFGTLEDTSKAISVMNDVLKDLNQ